MAGESTNGRGVSTIIIPIFEYKIIGIIGFSPDKEGRYLFLTLETESKYTLILVNVYGPNNDDPSWISGLLGHAEKYECNFMLFAGDWNVALKKDDFYN